MTLEEARERVGAAVVYQAYDGAPYEQGQITSVNDSYVFVRYGTQLHAAATRADDLRLLGDARLRPTDGHFAPTTPA